MLKKQLLIPLGIFIFLVVATIAIILYGNGYRFGFSQGQVAFGQTGILVTKSQPNGAQVFINDHLTTATDNTINLTPGTYKVKIYKEGYFPWQKTITIRKEIVSQANALLFPTAPTSLQAITNLGALNPVIDPTQSKVAFTVASQSAQKNGIYVLDISSRPLLALQGGSTQIADDTNPNALFSTSTLQWSPDSSQLLASVPTDITTPTSYLLTAGGLNQSPQDVTETIDTVMANWKSLSDQKTKAQLAGLPKALQQYGKTEFGNMVLSPDETKILYQATTSATLPFIKLPRLIGLDSTPEERNLEKSFYYVYDIKNDQNFKLSIDTPQNEEISLKWFPDSNHLVYVHQQKIDIMDYDGANPTTIYAGPFIDHYVFTAANDTSKIVILTNFDNQNIPPNLYSISLQ